MLQKKWVFTNYIIWVFGQKKILKNRVEYIVVSVEWKCIKCWIVAKMFEIFDFCNVNLQ